MNKKAGFSCLILLLAVICNTHGADALPSLQIAPLKYQTTLSSQKPLAGYITVSNPTDTSVSVFPEVQAIRQTGLHGDLEYFTDPRLAAGIRLPSGSILLPPRAAVNVRFILDPSRLPGGGVYAAIFFQTVPQPVHAPGSRINQALRIGTLLLLQNGYKGTAQASIESLQLPNFSYSHSLIGSAIVNNRGTLAFYPHLSARVNGFHAGMKVGSPYILPASRRQLQFELTGNYIGPIHIVLADRQHQLVASDWIWVVTGYWQWLLPTIVVVIFSFIGYRFRVGHRSPVYTVSKGRGDVK